KQEITLKALGGVHEDIVSIDIPNTQEKVSWSLTENGLKIVLPDTKRLKKPITLRIIVKSKDVP
ncbi:MAG: hypothetical protein QXG81_07390, partial [Ignisphaera sp.]